MNGYVDRQSALRMGKLLGPTALIFVKISGCDVQQHRNNTEHKNHKGEIERSYDAIAEIHIRGTLQTVDLATGRIFSASLIVEDARLSNHSTDAPPEFPNRRALRDDAIGRAAYDASTMFVNWTEQKQLYFFNDKECNMALAYTLLKSNDFDGVIRQSEENIVACKTWPKLKDNSLAHAYYNAGLAYLLINQYDKALFYLRESARLKGGEIVTETMTQANNSARLDEEMRHVAERTEQFEQEQEDRTGASQPPPDISSQPANSNAAQNSPEERLKKLDSLYKKGLINTDEYEAKRAVILKDI
jgi:tetratricopeptide (TPR) repeat protein